MRVAGNITSLVSAEWGRPMLCPASCTATDMRAASGSGAPVWVRRASEMAARRTRPSWSQVRSVCPARSKSKWSIQRTVMSAPALSGTIWNRTPIPVCSHRSNASRTSPAIRGK